MCGTSTAYGILSYITAYLKYYHPVEFMTSLLITKIGDYGQITKCIDACNEMNIKVLPPDINESERVFSISNGHILFGLEAINGIGEVDTTKILDERENGHFNGLSDFYSRCKLGSGSMVSLIKSGAFGSDKNKLLLELCNLMFDSKEFKPVKTTPTKNNLLELGVIENEEQFKDKELRLRLYNEYKKSEFEEKQKEKYLNHLETFKFKYMGDLELYEFETLSIFLTNNPFSDYKHIFKPLDDREDKDDVLIGGVISNI